MSFWRWRLLETDAKVVIKRLEEMYRDYEVDISFLERMDDGQKIKGMKGILAELDLKKKVSYTQDDLCFIKKVYSIFC